MSYTKTILSGLKICGLALAIVSCTGPTADDALDEVSVRFPIPIIENGQSPFYLAQDRGYYKEQGLDVTFNMGSPELNPVRMVAAGEDEFGVLGGPDTLLVARSRDVPLKAIAILHRNSNFPVVLVNDDSEITSVEDLDGKRVGFFFGHISTDVLRSFFNRAGITVEEVDIGFDYSRLITGQVDAAWAFTVTAGIDLPAQGHPVRMISPTTVGIETHGYTLFATSDYLDENKDIAERFVKATLQGVADAVADPQAAVDALEARNPDLDPDISMQRQLAYNAVTSIGTPYYLGYMDDEMMSETYERLSELGVLDGSFDLAEAFDASVPQDNQPD